MPKGMKHNKNISPNFRKKLLEALLRPASAVVGIITKYKGK
jgi:hypothetical protein